MKPNDSDPSNPAQPFAGPLAESQATARLSPDDARILDLLVDAGFDMDELLAQHPELGAADRQRADRLLAHCSLLDAYPDDAQESHADAATLLDATMARIDAAEGDRRDRMRLDPVRSPIGGRRFRFPDLIAVASIAILAAVVLVPLLNWRQARAIDLKCENNLRLIAEGLDSYTRSFDGSMPMTAGLLPDLGAGERLADRWGSWLGYRNADNLNPLKAGHYCSDGCLCCPGDHDPSGCYAYQVATGERRPQWQLGPTTAVVGDRNPLVDLKRNGETIGSVALNSASHGGRGQNLLFSDGAVRFSGSPYLAPAGLPGGTAGTDNIWLPFGDRADSLLDRPVGGVDAFLLH